MEWDKRLWDGILMYTALHCFSDLSWIQHSRDMRRSAAVSTLPSSCFLEFAHHGHGAGRTQLGP
eukprot:1161045-Pelagomonas_calceolata.AAC.24